MAQSSPPNNGDCPYCKAKKSLVWESETKSGKQFYKCAKCKEQVSK